MAVRTPRQPSLAYDVMQGPKQVCKEIAIFRDPFACSFRHFTFSRNHFNNIVARNYRAALDNAYWDDVEEQVEFHLHSIPWRKHSQSAILVDRDELILHYSGIDD